MANPRVFFQSQPQSRRLRLISIGCFLQVCVFLRITNIFYSGKIHGKFCRRVCSNLISFFLRPCMMHNTTTQEPALELGQETVLARGVDPNAKTMSIDEDLYDDLQKDHVEALSIIWNGMIRRQLNNSQIDKNLSNFFYYCERIRCLYLFNNRKLSLDDLDRFKLEY